MTTIESTKGCNFMMLTKQIQNILEYVSMRLRQGYAVRNALWWLEIEGRTIGYKKMETFMKINVECFGDHDTLVALRQLRTKSFINHWALALFSMFIYQL